MKHGVAFRKFSRTSSHRMLMLRNLVSSLFEHEQIKTTLPKARDTARLAEKMITLGKKGDRQAQHRAAAFLLKPTLLPKLFGTFAERYAERPGGYTRIHKFGNRPGDNAPHAILELVDNPRDLRTEITARSIGWELLADNLKTEKPMSLINRDVETTQEFIRRERCLNLKEDGQLRSKTRWNLQKVLKYRDQSATSVIGQKVGNYIDSLLAKPMVFRSLYDSLKKAPGTKRSLPPPRPRVGEVAPGETRGAMELAQGAIVRSRFKTRWHRDEAKPVLLDQRTVFGPR